MVRPIYAHELCDPDFSWLLNTFRENNPEYFAIESSCLPVILINFAPELEKEVQHEFEKDQFPAVEESPTETHKERQKA